MVEILSATNVRGKHFRVDLSRGAAGETWLQTLMETHAGGTWTLQSRVPGGTWVDTDVTHNDDGVKRWTASPAWEYRLNGGTTGGVAFVAAESEGAIRLAE